MADATEEKGITVVPRIHELLFEVHQELFKGHQGLDDAYWKDQLDMGEGARPSLPRTETLDG